MKISVKLRLELNHTNSLLYIIILMKDDKMNAERGNKNINNPLQKKESNFSPNETFLVTQN